MRRFWSNYAGLRESCFVPRAPVAHGAAYADFSPALTDLRAIAGQVNGHAGVRERHEAFMKTLEAWWTTHLPVIEALAPDAKNRNATPSRNVYAMRATLLDSIARALAGQDLLSPFQVRGAFANYYNRLTADFKSIAASGWGPELIPDEEILQSEFPQVLAELEQQHSRLAELKALFAAAGEEDFEDSDDSGVLPPDEVKELKASLKDAKGRVKLAKRDRSQGDVVTLAREVAQIEARLARHKALEDEVRTLRSLIKTTEKSRDELVEQARLKISADQARQVIVARLRRLLLDSYRQYLRADQRACVAAIENLWRKYAVTARQIEAERDAAARELQAFLVELGYVA
jgi:type I restriction enzyme M protein